MEATERTIEDIEKDIAAARAELENVHGTETEVYARIVGYYRAVKNWNKGKSCEFNQRRMFEVNDEGYSVLAAQRCGAEEKAAPAVEAKTEEVGEVASYEMFVRKTCPNCPPVKAYMADVKVLGRSVDVDSEAGLKEAASKGVFAAPTVILYNKAGNEVGRCHTVEELTAVFEKVAVEA
ncbi:MAG: anaerobic ribonucleoside-triphosphate reductase [Treponema sp.]|nr:anaerobic ribonucleoside-triphosphate reductase [Treponema sp.]